MLCLSLYSIFMSISRYSTGVRYHFNKLKFRLKKILFCIIKSSLSSTQIECVIQNKDDPDNLSRINNLEIH